MKTMKLGTSDLQVPVIAVGCLRITGLNQAEAERFVQTALDAGANFLTTRTSTATASASVSFQKPST